MKTKTQFEDFIITILFFANNKNIYLILVQIQVTVMNHNCGGQQSNSVIAATEKKVVFLFPLPILRNRSWKTKLAPRTWLRVNLCILRK